jgi:hypothetical protein
MSVDLGRRDSVSQEDTTPVVPRNHVHIHIRVLTTVDQIEREALELLKKQSFCHTKIFKPVFIIKTGLKQDMICAFSYAGWYDFANITETGSQLLTMQLLMSLGIEETAKKTKIYFHFFDEQYELTTKELSVALGFSKKCLLDPNALIKDYQYDRTTWWNEISEEPLSSKNSIVSIHNPTLRLLAKWLYIVVHTHSDLCLSSLPEMQCLFAMAKKIKFSSIMSMLAHWQKMITGRGRIDITSLVTCITAHVGALDNAQVTYLPLMEAFQYRVGLEHFVQGHMMREGLDNSLFMCCPRYDRKIEIPCLKLSLYLVK